MRRYSARAAMRVQRESVYAACLMSRRLPPPQMLSIDCHAAGIRHARYCYTVTISHRHAASSYAPPLRYRHTRTFDAAAPAL